MEKVLLLLWNCRSNPNDRFNWRGHKNLLVLKSFKNQFRLVVEAHRLEGTRMKTQVVEAIKIQAGEKVPVFPLPNSVLFPHIELPLYIFEQRYRQMLEDCLHGNSLIAIALLKKGWEMHQEPLPCYDTVGVGYVKISVQDQEGNFNIILKGVSRAKISEYIQWEPYRIAKVVPILSTGEDGKEISWRVRKLSKLFAEKVFRTKKMKEEEIHALEKITDPEELSNLVAFTSSIDFHTKQNLLETLDIEKRLDQLIKILEEALSEIKSHPHS